jgi:hypothetical protein
LGVFDVADYRAPLKTANTYPKQKRDDGGVVGKECATEHGGESLQLNQKLYKTNEGGYCLKNRNDKQYVFERFHGISWWSVMT